MYYLREPNNSLENFVSLYKKCQDRVLSPLNRSAIFILKFMRIALIFFTIKVCSIIASYTANSLFTICVCSIFCYAIIYTTGMTLFKSLFYYCGFSEDTIIKKKDLKVLGIMYHNIDKLKHLIKEGKIKEIKELKPRILSVTIDDLEEPIYLNFRFDTNKTIMHEKNIDLSFIDDFFDMCNYIYMARYKGNYNE